MSDLPISSPTLVLDEDGKDDFFFSVKEISVAQVNFLKATKSISIKNGIPLYIESIGQAKFKIKPNLDAYIMLLKTFQREDLTLTTPQGTSEVTPADLLKFIFD